MNKPTCEQLIEQLGNNEDITICSDVVYGLGFEYQQLKNRIDKAIKYINNNKLYNYDYDEEEMFEIVSDTIAKDYLLTILKGRDKE